MNKEFEKQSEDKPPKESKKLVPLKGHSRPLSESSLPASPPSLLTVSNTDKRHRNNSSPNLVQNRLRRLASEFKEIAASEPPAFDLSLNDDDLSTWYIKLYQKDFPISSKLYEDIEELQQREMGDHILLEISFPEQYPYEPPFFRVIKPRFCWHTGHVSWGGSVCLEALVSTGSSQGYSPSYSVLGLIYLVVHNFTANDEMSNIGTGRIDFKRQRSPERTTYDKAQAVSDFVRIASQHGWMKASKPVCRFAPNCYRKNPDHLRKFLHPPAPPPPRKINEEKKEELNDQEIVQNTNEKNPQIPNNE